MPQLGVLSADFRMPLAREIQCYIHPAAAARLQKCLKAIYAECKLHWKLELNLDVELTTEWEQLSQRRCGCRRINIAYMLFV